MADSKVAVTITHRAPGIQPPVYVAGTFSNPQWVPEPMEHTTGEDGVHTFTKTLELEPRSQIQYKYRVGEGDWWMLDENSPIATDGSGNRNNYLETPEAPQKSEEEQHVSKEPTVDHTKESPETTTDKQDGSSTEDILPAAGVDVQLPQPEAPSTSDEPAVSATDDASEPVQEQVLEPDVEKEPSKPPVEAISEGPRPVSKVDMLKQSELIERKMSRTPEIAAEVADSAALLDFSTPEPDSPAEPVGEIEDKQQPSTPHIADIADKAAEADIAAEVADTAESLDADEPKVQPKSEPSFVDPSQDAAEVAAEVADSAETLDADEPEVRLDKAPPAYQRLADLKTDFKDDSLDIAGYSNDPEPVPLFAHECAGLYEDDEIPGEDDVEDRGKTNGRLRGHNNEDFDDPTLERFPSTKGEIMSTVRKVETGLNKNQTSVDGVPPSPVAKAPRSSTMDARGDHSEPDSPTSARGQQNLSLPPPLSHQSLSERSVSAASLHSIAEGAEGEEAEKPKVEDIASVAEPEVEKSVAEEIAPVVEQAKNADNSIQPTGTTDGEEVQQSKAEEIAPQVEKAETADEAILVAKEAEGEAALAYVKPALQPLVTVPSPSVKPSTGLLSPVSDDDEAVVLKNGKGKEKSTESERPGHQAPERATSPKPEEPGSPREPPPNAAEPVAEYDIDNDVLKADPTPAFSEPRSPQIVVSNAEGIQPEEELLPAPSLDKTGAEEAEASNETETSKGDVAPQVAQAAVDTQTPKDVETAPEILDAPKGVEASKTNEASPVNGSEDAGSTTETAATSSALAEDQSGLKKRSVAKPDPTDRTGTPTSITEPHREAAKSGNWFSAFFRLIFIDLVGGFVSRLCGGRRKT